MKEKFLSVALASTMIFSSVVPISASEVPNLTDGLVEEFLFEDLTGELDSGNAATKIGEDSATSLVQDDTRGNVVNLQGGTVTKTIVDPSATDKLYTSVAPSGLQMPSTLISGNDYSNGFTLSMWAKSVGANGFSGIVDISDQNGDYSWGHIEVAAAPQFRYNGWGLSGVAGDDWFETGEWPEKVSYWLGDGGWEMLTISVSKSEIVLYVDKTALYTDTNTEHCNRILSFLTKLGESGRTSFRLGTFITPGNWDWNWDAYKGLMDDVRLYNRALSSEEVTALYSVAADNSVLVGSQEVNSQDAKTYAQYKKVADNNYTVRLISEVEIPDISAYNQVGFRCAKSAAVTESTENYLGTKIFKSIKANGKTVTAADNKYFVVLEIQNVTSDATIYAQPISQADTTIGTLGQAVTVKMADIVK